MMIKVDSERGKLYGFTSDIFTPDSYLWDKDGTTIFLSMITKCTEQKGCVEKLIKNIESFGYEINVPTPFAIMIKVISRLGFKPAIVNDELYGLVEVWKKVKPATKETE